MRTITQNPLAMKAKLLLMMFLVFIQVNKLHASNYYWVGGTGSWNDFANHWATSSGGSIYHTSPPTLNDNVIVDSNSFSISNSILSLPNGAITCRDLNISNSNLNTISGNGGLQVFGSLNLVSNVNVSPMLVLGATTIGTYTIKTSGNIINLSIIGAGSSYYFQDPFTGDLFISGSEVFTNNLSPFNINTTFKVLYYGIFHAGTSLINVLNNADMLVDSTATVEAGLANLNVTGLFEHSQNGIPIRIKKITASSISACGDSIIHATVTVTNPFQSSVFARLSDCYVQKLDINNPFFLTTVLENSTLPVPYFVDTLILNSAALIRSNQTQYENQINNLFIQKGDSCFFSYTDTTIINAIKIFGSSNYPTGMFCWGFPTGISGHIKSPNPICLDSMIIGGMSYEGSSVFNAGANSIDAGDNNGISFTNCSGGLAYYWVGGTGNWSDVSHWATTSGGTTFHTTAPDSTDDVYFVTNSFTSNNDTVYIDGANATCNNFNWNVPLWIPVVSGSTIPIKVSGNLTLQSTIDWRLDEVELLSFNGTISTNSNHLRVITIDNYSSYQLLDDLTCGYLNLFNTRFNSNNKTITVGNISCNPIAVTIPSPCDFGTSVINIVNDPYSGGINTEIGNGTNVSGVTINIIKDGGWLHFSHNYSTIPAIYSINIPANSSGVNSVITGPFNCQKLIADQIVSITPQLLLGRCSILNAVFRNDVYLNTGIFVDTILFDNPGKTIQLPFGDTLFVNNDLFLSYAAGLFGLMTSVSTAYVSVNNGTVCLNNMNLQNISVIGSAQFFAGNGCVDLGGNTGWTFAPCNNVSDVWPGDANYDLTVNNNDVLNIGLSYNETGPVRSGATLAYVAQPAADWNAFFQTAVNHKHADTNGDGVVNGDDTTAVSLNYGLTHPARMGSTASNTSASGIPLYIDVQPDSAALSDTVDIDVMLGTASMPVDSIYGLAFTLNFDTTYVDTAYIASDYSLSWMGTTGVDLLCFDKKLAADGKIDVAITRTDHSNINGFGSVARFTVVIVDNVSGRMIVPFTLSNVSAITANEYGLLLDVNADSLSLDTTTNIFPLADISGIYIYPNPTKDILKIKSTVQNIFSAELTDTFGRKLMTINNSSARELILPVHNLNKGIYILNVTTDRGVVKEKIIKQ